MNPRFKCSVCRHWTIRRGTRKTQRIALCYPETLLCLECGYDTYKLYLTQRENQNEQSERNGSDEEQS